MKIRLLAAFALTGCLIAPAFAQDTYPNRPVRIVVGYPAGGTLDKPARVIAQELTRLSGQSFIVENRPGASANIAADMIAKAEGDGYSLLLSSASLSSSGAFFRNLAFHPVKDFRHIGTFCTLPTLIVARNDLPANTLAELVELARKEPGKYTFGSPGTGTGAHIAGELLNRFANVDLLHVPHKGAAQGLTSVAGGHIDLMIAGLATLESAVRNKQVKVLAVTNPEPSPELVDAPTIRQALGSYEVPREYQFTTWLGLSAPASTSDAVVAKLEQWLKAALENPKVREDLKGIGVTASYSTSAALNERVATEVPAYATIVREMGINVQQ